jgi:hypothetical protein
MYRVFNGLTWIPALLRDANAHQGKTFVNTPAARSWVGALFEVWVEILTGSLWPMSRSNHVGRFPIFVLSLLFLGIIREVER